MRSESDTVLFFPVSKSFICIPFFFSNTKVTSERFNIVQKIYFLHRVSIIFIAEAVFLL